MLNVLASVTNCFCAVGISVTANGNWRKKCLVHFRQGWGISHHLQ